MLVQYIPPVFDSHIRGVLEGYLAIEIYKAIAAGDRETLAKWLAYLPKKGKLS